MSLVCSHSALLLVGVVRRGGLEPNLSTKPTGGWVTSNTVLSSKMENKFFSGFLRKQFVAELAYELQQKKKKINKFVSVLSIFSTSAPSWNIIWPYIQKRSRLFLFFQLNIHFISYSLTLREEVYDLNENHRKKLLNFKKTHSNHQNSTSRK